VEGVVVDEDFEAVAEVEVDAGGDGDFGFGAALPFHLIA
jgi:hypothetical protein